MLHTLLTSSSKLSTSLNTLFPHYKTKDNHIVYNVFEYAWQGWEAYIHKCAKLSAKIMLLGINPGPHGMLQTGIPFGSISAVRNYIGIHDADIKQPTVLHKNRPVDGMKYTKEEQSGLLLWNTIESLFTNSLNFFSHCFVINYCPLAFFTQKGENITPDKLGTEERKDVEHRCTSHLLEYLNIFNTSLILAIGRYAFNKAQLLSRDLHIIPQKNIIYIPHPSPLNRNRILCAPTLKNVLKKYTTLDSLS